MATKEIRDSGIVLTDVQTQGAEFIVPSGDYALVIGKASGNVSETAKLQYRFQIDANTYSAWADEAGQSLTASTPTKLWKGSRGLEYRVVSNSAGAYVFLSAAILTTRSV